ncbi:MAG: phosphatidylglycerophosphatase A [Thiolinea sp.]
MLTKTVLSSPIHLLAFGFGSGLSPLAPGTIGTLAAIPLYLLMARLPWAYYILILVAAIAVGIWLCGESARLLGVHDHGGIVWDEFVGFWITMLFVPPEWLWIVLGFLLFRLFDVWKPWPIRLIDKQVDGGLGIMLDDILAGIYALLVLHIMMIVFAGYSSA